MRRFCTSGTCSKGSSTPRSPRATITASATPTMRLSDSSAVAFSIFATIFIVGGTSVRSSSMSSAPPPTKNAAGGGPPPPAPPSPPPHERERQVVHSVLHAVRDVLAILLGERRCRHVDVGQIHALVRRQDSAVHHPAAHPRGADARRNPD